MSNHVDLLLEHGVGREPLPQTLSQAVGLVHAGFGHEDHKFVAAVTGDYVRLTALLFQQPADAGQHQITLKVAQAVVYFFELIEVNQHY